MVSDFVEVEKVVFKILVDFLDILNIVMYVSGMIMNLDK